MPVTTAATSATEKMDATWLGMDQWPAVETGTRLCAAQLTALACFNQPECTGAIAAAGTAAAQRLQGSSGRLIYCGAGSAGAQACIDGLELPGTFGWPKERLVLLLAGGWDSFFADGGAAEDDTETARQAIAELVLTADDVLIAVSASGNTAYTVAAATQARDSGALVIGLCNNTGSLLQQQSGHCVVLLTGAEAIAGSTRLAAGSAQKIALNSLSTLIMAQLGYLYDNLMIRLKVSNQKLLGRAVKMVSYLCHCDEDQALQSLKDAGHQVPVAVLLQQGLQPGEAQGLLERHKGSLRAALADCA